MKIVATVMLFASILSCAQETPKVKHVAKAKPQADLKKVKVVNAIDPICQMKTADAVSDTAIYKKKVYGFCSGFCKKEFKKNPAKYAQGK